MNQRTTKIYIKPTHPDWSRVAKDCVSARRLYNGLLCLARIVHARYSGTPSTVFEEGTRVDERLLDVYSAREWADDNPSLAGSYSYEKIRKNVALVQGIILPQKIAQRVGTKLAKNFASFYALRKEGLYSNPPKYKRQYGLVEYTVQALSFKKNKGHVVPSGWQTGVKLPSHIGRVQAARLYHSHGKVFVLEIIHEVDEARPVVGGFEASIDLGVNNLIALVTTKPGERPKVINGRALKSINQYYNKASALLRSRLKKAGHDHSTRLDTLWAKRSRKINHHLHAVSSQVIKYLENTGVGVLVIGWNVGFKQSAKMGKKNNQNFVMIPHARLRDMLSYKAQSRGIRVVIQEESYTSKASFMNHDEIPTYGSVRGKPPIFTGKRTSRGNYKNNNNTLIHADINAAWNILRKSNPTTRWSSGIIVMPERLKIKL